ncbi:MAG: TldD/PmbA family protein [Thermoflexales bacterium]|nr:TldD/PmbA family protein [Thermoflexales bacterium]
MKIPSRNPVSSESWQRVVETVCVEFQANRLRSVQVQEFESQAVRVLSNGRLGHAITTEASVDQARLLQRASSAARYGPPMHMAFPPTRLVSGPADPRLSTLSASDLAALGEEMTAIICQTDPRVMVELKLRCSRERARIHNSEGGATSSHSTRLLVDAWVERHQGDEVLVVFDAFGSARLDGGHRRFAERIARRLAWARQARRVKPGRQPLILSPAAVAVLIRPLIMALSGRRAQSGSSPLAGKLGQALFDPRLTLVDDGTLRDRPDGGLVDHEGVPTQRTVLIRNGVLERFYYDLHTAALAGVPSTGNGRREMLTPPCPLPTNIVLEAGQTSLDDMIASMGEGLLVDQLMGAGPASGLRGSFSRTIALGYQIEQGRVTAYVKGAALAGNLYKLLNSLVAIGDTLTWSGNVCLPYLQVSGLSVTA